MTGTRVSRTESGIRFTEGSWELRCDDCAREHEAAHYWPLTLAFWNPAWGMTRCRACWLARFAARARQRRRGLAA